MNECIFVVQICCYNKRGIVMKQLNSHLLVCSHVLCNPLYLILINFMHIANDVFQI
jgi:hypothetical protein